MLAFLLACTGAPPAEEAAEPVIIATSFPAFYLAQRLAPGLDVRCILPPGEDPPDWQPDGALIASIAEADLIVANGAGYEAWMKTAALPERRVVDLSEGIAPIHLEGETHSHGVGGEHSHAGLDPHTWLDPLNYSEQAAVLAARLEGLSPDAAAQLPTLQAELATLHEGYAAALTDPRRPDLVANHPAYHYLARRHGLTIPSLDLDPEAVPEAPPVIPQGAVLLWETPPSEAVQAAVVARHVVLDPLEQPAEGGYDYRAQTEGNITRLKELLAEAASGDDSQR